MEQLNQIMKEVHFWTSRVILTAAELDIFTLLDEGPSYIIGACASNKQ